MFDRNRYLLSTPKAVLALIESGFLTTIDEEWDCDICDALSAAQDWAETVQDEDRKEHIEAATFAWNEDGDCDAVMYHLETAFEIGG
jgi:hypothetical protein